MFIATNTAIDNLDCN